MNSDTIFIWVYLPNSLTPVVAGRLDVSRTPSGDVGSFVYGKTYLGRGDAIPLDPVTLPLDSTIRQFTSLKGFPGVIIDSCPDKWGIKVIDRLSGQKEYPSGYILMNDPGRAGALAFSRSASDVPQELESREFPLADLMFAAEAVENGQEVEPELLKALHPGTGGARPKCNVVDGDGVWIAKFHSIEDSPLISLPRLEHATMTLAGLCGVRAAPTRIERIGDKDVCLVKRFDRLVTPEGVFRSGYLSARSVFFADPGFQDIGVESYARFSRWLGKYGCPVSEQTQLFRRMVFNVAVRNSDDHSMNHGLSHQKDGSWMLSEAFDIVPVITPQRVHQHAMIIGETAFGTVDNLLSNVSAFGLSLADASNIIHEIQSIIRNHWHEVMYEAGFGDENIRNVERLFMPIPLN